MTGKYDIGRPLDRAVYDRIRENWDRVAKPLSSLGRFEDIITVAGAVLGREDADLSRRAVIIMCSDNGIVEEGVSQSGQDVTAAVAGWMGRGESSVCRMAAVAGADTVPVDIGINMEGSPEGVLARKVRRGTRNFLKEPAMTEEEAARAIQTGIDIVKECRDNGYTILATGEMGIGNTTTSSAVCAALLDIPAEKVTGRGAGLSDKGLLKKMDIISQAIEKYGLREGREDASAHAWRVLCSVGGLDIAGLTGVFIGGAMYRVPVIIDGLISAAAALTAERLAPGCREAMIASHAGRDPGLELILDELGLEPVIYGDLALGEGTGAVMLYPLLDMALSLYRDGLRFSETEVGQYERFESVPRGQSGKA